MRTFEHFPKDEKCPICGESNDSECILLPIDGTSKGNICKAQPFHTKCLLEIDKLRFTIAGNFVYRHCR